ncbi:MAG TPA: DUF962 domain-containing protein [bacterium]|nr:DUF962 domain-containing protein [bacterium]
MNQGSEESGPSFLETYRAKHQHPVNRVLHTAGIPMIVLSLGVVFWDWRWGLGLFALGWILQFVGHVFEGKAPAFFSNPIHLLVGPVWWAKKIISRDRSKTSASAP